MKTSIVSDLLLSDVKNSLVRRRSITTILFSALSLSISVISFIVLITYDFGYKSELEFYISFVMIAFLIAAILQFIFGKKLYYYKPENVPVKCHLYFFDTTSEKLIQAVKTNDINFLKSVVNDYDRGIKMELAYTPNYSIAICQCYKYVPYEYIPDSEVITLTNSEVELLLNVK